MQTPIPCLYMRHLVDRRDRLRPVFPQRQLSAAGRPDARQPGRAPERQGQRQQFDRDGGASDLRAVEAHGHMKNAGTARIALDAGSAVAAGKNQTGVMAGLKYTF